VEKRNLTVPGTCATLTNNQVADRLSPKAEPPPFPPVVKIDPRWAGPAQSTPGPLWDLDQLQIPRQWLHYGVRGEGVNCYVVDSGCDPDHIGLAHLGPALTVRSLVRGTTDETGHGTWVAGKIAGQGVGIAPRCHLTCLKVLDDSGTGSADTVNQALAWIADRPHPHVVNLSLGSSQPSPDQARLIDRLHRRGTLVVVAAGNQGSAAPFYPAWYPGCLVVAAYGQTHDRQPWSNSGPAVAISAPGRACYSLYPGQQYRALDGTSMASPIVAGVVALGISLLLGRAPGLSAVDIQRLTTEALLGTAIDLGALGRDPYYGAGGINPDGFLARLWAQVPGSV
jgi:subtilisin